MSEGFPEHIALRLDASTRRSADGTTVLGGAPMRLVRFNPAGARSVVRLEAGGTVGTDPVDQRVARVLLDAGMAHPRWPAPTAQTRAFGADDVTIVIPVHDGAADLARLLASLGGDDGVAGCEVVVVDDASSDAAAIAAAVDGCPRRVELRRLTMNRGPAAARNLGAADARAVVVFLDADVTPEPGWLDGLLAHLDDPTVGIVGPRVRSHAGDGSLLDRWERHRSPLDLGPDPARVVPHGRVTYLPSAALVVRREAFERLDGFDETRRVGEDVDLVWRAHDVGVGVRYAPEAVVEHRPRPDWPALVRQRHGYGTAAARLDAAHPGRVAPLECNAFSLAAWVAVLTGRRAGVGVGVAIGVGSTAALVPRLRGRVDDPVRTAVELAGGGTLRLGGWLGRAVWRAWLPIAVAAAIRLPRLRLLLVAAAAGPAIAARRGTGTDIDPVTWSALWALDDAAYASGVWRGMARVRSLRCLRPRLTGIPGLTGTRPARSSRW